MGWQMMVSWLVIVNISYAEDAASSGLGVFTVLEEIQEQVGAVPVPAGALPPAVGPVPAESQQRASGAGPAAVLRDDTEQGAQHRGALAGLLQGKQSHAAADQPRTRQAKKVRVGSQAPHIPRNISSIQLTASFFDFKYSEMYEE